MASIASESRPEKRPLSQQAAFPVVVALWFAALFGLGSLIVPVTLIESAVHATGIAALVPAATPPLGFTARALIALLATLAGVVIGLAIARRVALAQASHPVRIPISAHEELGEALDGPQQAHGSARRRALAMDEDQGPSEFLDLAPLPGVDPAANPAALGPQREAANPTSLAEQDEDEDDDVLELCDFETPAEAQSDPDFMYADETDQPEDNHMTDPQPFDAPAPKFADTEVETAAGPTAPRMDFAPPARRQEFIADAPLPETSDESENETEPASANAPEQETPVMATVAASPPEPPVRDDWESAPPEKLGLVQLAQRLGAAIDKHRAFVSRRAELATSAAAVPSASMPNVPAPFEMAEADDAAEAMAAFFGSVPHDRAPTVTAPEQPKAVQNIEPAPVAEDKPAQPYRAPFQAFTNFAGVGDDAEDEDEHSSGIDALHASLSLPLGTKSQIATPTPAISASRSPAPSEPQMRGEQPEDDEDDDQGAFGSLLGSRNPFESATNRFVRIEDEPEPMDGSAQPAVVFPGQEERSSVPTPAPSPTLAAGNGRAFDPPTAKTGVAHAESPSKIDTAERERALREALLNLQRMSGAA